MHRYAAAVDKLRTFLSEPDRLNAIHYACETFYYSSRPSRISAIAVKNYGSGETKTFSIYKSARNDGSIGALTEDVNYAKAEKALLEEFFLYVTAQGENARWLNWNMNSETYGFPVFYARLKQLGGVAPNEISLVNRLDLDTLLEDIYGKSYCCSPKLVNTVQMNNLRGADFMSGDKEAFAFEAGKWEEIHNSAQEKPSAILNIANLANKHQLKTHTGNLQAHLFGWLDAQKTDHPVSFYLSLIGGIGSILGIWSFFHK